MKETLDSIIGKNKRPVLHTICTIRDIIDV